MKCGLICARSALHLRLHQQGAGGVQFREFHLGGNPVSDVVGSPDQPGADGRRENAQGAHGLRVDAQRADQQLAAVLQSQRPQGRAAENLGPAAVQDAAGGQEDPFPPHGDCQEGSLPRPGPPQCPSPAAFRSQAARAGGGWHGRLLPGSGRRADGGKRATPCAGSRTPPARRRIPDRAGTGSAGSPKRPPLRASGRQRRRPERLRRQRACVPDYRHRWGRGHETCRLAHGLLRSPTQGRDKWPQMHPHWKSDPHHSRRAGGPGSRWTRGSNAVPPHVPNPRRRDG